MENKRRRKKMEGVVFEASCSKEIIQTELVGEEVAEGM